MPRTPFFVIPVVAFGLAACDPGDPNKNTKEIGGVGAAVGGLIGAATSDGDLEKTAIGAAIGGVVGAAIGSSLDAQERDLRKSLDSDDIGIVNTGSELRVTMPQDLLFATDSAVLQPELQSDLRVLARSLNDYPDTRVFVVGHTDSTGAASYNQVLSENRARTVAGVLSGSGVAVSRLRVQGAGEARPVASNGNASGRAQNRRVEIIIRPTST